MPARWRSNKGCSGVRRTRDGLLARLHVDVIAFATSLVVFEAAVLEHDVAAAGPEHG